MDAINLLRADFLTKPNVGTDQQRAELLGEIRKAQKAGNPLDRSNDGCWRSERRYGNSISWLMSDIGELLNQFAALYKSEVDFHNLDPAKVSFFYWTNVNKPHSRNVLHSHIDAHFSAVYYLQGTGTGALKLMNPANILGNCNDTAPFVKDFMFVPNDGDLIMWPSWVPHEVETNFSDRERINLVFDIIIRK